MRISPEFPCDNPAYFEPSQRRPRLVLVPTPAPAPVPEADAALRPSGVFLLGEVSAEPAHDGAPPPPARGEVHEVALDTLVFGDLEALEPETEDVVEDACGRGRAGETVEPELEAVADEALDPGTEEVRGGALGEEPFDRDLVPVVRDLAGVHGEALAALLSRLEPPRAPELRAALERAHVADAGGVSASFAARVRGFRALLRGEEGELDALGGRMLDEWLAELLAAALGDPSRRNELRRALRARGVCAFGLV